MTPKGITFDQLSSLIQRLQPTLRKLGLRMRSEQERLAAESEANSRNIVTEIAITGGIGSEDYCKATCRQGSCPC